MSRWWRWGPWLVAAAARLGVGLHLWSQKDGFFLHDQLTKEDA